MLKFLQLISLGSASWELHQYSRRRMCGQMKNPKDETRFRDSNSGPHDCEADTLPHNHGHQVCSKNARGKNVRGKIATGKNVRVKLVKIP